MSTIALPIKFRPDSFSMRLSTTQRVHSSNFGGSEQAVDMLNDRWYVTLSLPLCGREIEAAQREAFINAMRGMTNTCNLYHYGRPYPRGTMRGTPSCTATAAGAASIQIGSAGAGATLLAGDMISVGGLLLQVASDCSADGAGFIASVPLVNRVRKAIASNAPVFWDKPAAAFRMISAPAVQHVTGYSPGISLDFAEVIQ